MHLLWQLILFIWLLESCLKLVLQRIVALDYELLSFMLDEFKIVNIQF